MSTDPTSTFTTGYVTSHDATRIGYRQFGKGPVVLLVHGAGAAAQNFTNLAEGLADEFSVVVPDRRGRGLSGPFGENYSARSEVGDVLALIEGTGATNLFGHSSGALLALEAALSRPTITKLTLYEPPLSVNHSVSSAWVERYDQEVAAGRLGPAMITALKGTGVAPPALRLAPRFVLAALLGALLRRVGPEPGAVSLVDLIPTLHYDAVIVAAGEGRLGAFADIEATVLLLGGSRSPKYIKSALAALEETLPNASRVELRGCGHSAPDNDAQPTHVAEELIRFFS